MYRYGTQITYLQVTTRVTSAIRFFSGKPQKITLMILPTAIIFRYVFVTTWLFVKFADSELVDGPLVCGPVLLYGWFELHNTVYTLSILLSFSKNGIRSRSSESFMSSNHEATGT